MELRYSHALDEPKRRRRPHDIQLPVEEDVTGTSPAGAARSLCGTEDDRIGSGAAAGPQQGAREPQHGEDRAALHVANDVRRLRHGAGGAAPARPMDGRRARPRLAAYSLRGVSLLLARVQTL